MNNGTRHSYTETNQAEEPCQNWQGNGGTFEDAITNWENRIGLVLADRGGYYLNDAKYPWRLAKANLDENFDKRHEWRQDEFRGSMVNDVNVFKKIYSDSQKQVAILKEKIEKKDVDKRDKDEYKAGVLWIKDYRRRIENENRRKRRQDKAGKGAGTSQGSNS